MARYGARWRPLGNRGVGVEFSLRWPTLFERVKSDKSTSEGALVIEGGEIDGDLELMDTNLQAQQLHDKATRGIALSPEEQLCLEKWYALQDQEELQLLTRTSPPQTLEALQTQVNTALAQLPAVLQRVKALANANDSLRKEIISLQEQLAQTPAIKES